MSGRGPLRLVIGAGGAVLIGSLFLHWARGRSGWTLLTGTDAFFAIVGAVALAAGLTGGHIGVFRRDVSLNGAADLLSVVAIVVLAWLAIFDLPGGARPGGGLFVALASAIAIACAAGDYGVLRGVPLFPRLEDRPTLGDGRGRQGA